MKAPIRVPMCKKSKKGKMVKERMMMQGAAQRMRMQVV